MLIIFVKYLSVGDLRFDHHDPSKVNIWKNLLYPGQIKGHRHLVYLWKIINMKLRVFWAYSWPPTSNSFFLSIFDLLVNFEVKLKVKGIVGCGWVFHRTLESLYSMLQGNRTAWRDFVVKVISFWILFFPSLKIK